MSIDSPKSIAVEAELPVELRLVYRRLVTEYKYLTTLSYGRGYVAYRVIAGLVLAGWRPTGEAHETSPI